MADNSTIRDPAALRQLARDRMFLRKPHVIVRALTDERSWEVERSDKPAVMVGLLRMLIAEVEAGNHVTVHATLRDSPGLAPPPGRTWRG